MLHFLSIVAHTGVFNFLHTGVCGFPYRCAQFYTPVCTTYIAGLDQPHTGVHSGVHGSHTEFARVQHRYVYFSNIDLVIFNINFKTGLIIWILKLILILQKVISKYKINPILSSHFLQQISHSLTQLSQFIVLVGILLFQSEWVGPVNPPTLHPLR